MKLKNILLVVKDIEKSKQFYRELFGLSVILNQEGNVILTEGLVLQDENIWREHLGIDVVREHNFCELYFEEKELDRFAKKVEELYPSIQYINKLTTFEWGQKMLRFYDLDGHLIEVRTPMGDN